MVDVSSIYRLDQDAFERGYDRQNALRTDRARMQAGNALSGGDYGGAAGALFGAGDLAGGLQVSRYAGEQQSAQRKTEQDREKQVLDFTSDMATRLLQLNGNEDNADATVSAFDQYFAPRLSQLGETPEEIAEVRNNLAISPRQTLQMLGAAVEDRIKTYNTSNGVVAVNEGALDADFNDPNAARLLYEAPRDPLEEELMRARIDATRAQVDQREASAERSRRPAASGGRGGSGGGSAKLPAGFILD